MTHQVGENRHHRITATGLGRSTSGIRRTNTEPASHSARSTTCWIIGGVCSQQDCSRRTVIWHNRCERNQTVPVRELVQTPNKNWLHIHSRQSQEVFVPPFPLGKLRWFNWRRLCRVVWKQDRRFWQNLGMNQMSLWRIPSDAQWWTGSVEDTGGNGWSWWSQTMVDSWVL